MMAKVRTVLGDVDASTLGITNAHEHVMIRSGLILVREPDFRLVCADKGIEELRDFRRFGGGTVVDTAPIGIGRDPDSLRLISRETGVQIVAATDVARCQGALADPEPTTRTSGEATTGICLLYAYIHSKHWDRVHRSAL
jgi:predicted metal-dependent phosphotriesterase family hydrolase